MPSRARRGILIHVHGFGGDCLSNRFVRTFHESLPPAGLGFVSFQMRTSGYVIEQYGDRGVVYVGASITDPTGSARDVVAVLRFFANEGLPIVLQGHSFGTNLVKYILQMQLWTGPAIFLAPANSEALQVEFEASRPLCSTEGAGLSWTVFGITTIDRAYPIPIDRDTFRSVRTGPVFNTWGPDAPAVTTRCLVVRGSRDGIALCGGMATSLQRLLPHHDVVELGTDSHIFKDVEAQLTSEVVEWCSAVIDPRGMLK